MSIQWGSRYPEKGYPPLVHGLYVHNCHGTFVEYREISGLFHAYDTSDLSGRSRKCGSSSLLIEDGHSAATDRT